MLAIQLKLFLSIDSGGQIDDQGKSMKFLVLSCTSLKYLLNDSTLLIYATYNVPLNMLPLKGSTKVKK